MALTTRRPREWIRKDHEANRSLSPAFEAAESPRGESPRSPRGCCPPVPSAGQGAVQADPTRWQPYLPNKPLSPLLQRLAGKAGSSGQGKKNHLRGKNLSCEVSQDCQVFDTLSEKGIWCMQLKKKEENNFWGHSLTVCRSNLLFPNDKRASTAGSRAYGLKKEITDMIRPPSQ